MKKYFCLILFIIPFSLLAQKTIKGTVVDETKFPLPGASILVKGTTNGSVTDIDGNFTITIDATPAVLVVSYLGFISQEVIVTTQAQINVILKEDNQKLDEVVLIGYGQVQRGDLTGSVTSVKPLENAVAQSQGVEDLLQGRAAGVFVSANGSGPDATSSIKIRGLNSLTGNTEPLYVIDGIVVDSATEDTLDPLSGGNSYLSPQGGITGINPRDIESIEVLKDASATAIYGSRGANGVILITTKKGKAGKAKFNYSSTTKIGNIVNDIDVLDTNQYIQYVNEVRTNNSLQPLFYQYPDGTFASFQTSEDYMIQNSATIDRLSPINWSDDTYQTSITSNHRISASGGGDKGNYYFAAGYVNNEGIVPRAFARSTDFVANLNNDLTDKISLSTKFAASFTKNSASKGTDNLGSTNNNLVRQIVSGVPILNYSDNYFGADFEESVDGPRAWIKDYDDLSEEIRLLGSMKLDYKLSKTFTYRLQIGTDYRKKERQVWYGTSIFRGAQSNGEAGLSTLDRFRYNMDNTLMFKKRFNKNHRINGTVGVVIDQSQIQRTTNQASDFPNQDLRADGISYGQVFQPLFFDKQKETILSFLGRLNYTLYDRYLLTATFRADGSSKFAEGKRFGYFPAFAFAWKINKEPFLAKIESLSEAKLRLGWGLTGNQAIPNYRAISPTFGPTQSPYSDANGGALTAIVPAFLPNPDLIWETTSQYNAGIDLGFLNDRFTTTVDVYYKKISDLLLNAPIGSSNGFETYYANQGDLINKGIEFSMSADIIDNDNFKWNVYGNIAFNRNKIDRLGIPPASFGNETYSAFLGRQVSGGNYFKVPANIFIEGKAPALFYGFQTNGIVSNDDDLSNAPSYRGTAAQLGDVYLVDQNGDGDVNDSDLTIIGDPNPDFNYGFGSSVEYKGLSLSFFFNGVYGNDIANGNLLREAYADNATTNIRTEAYVNAWRPDNPNGTYPRVGYDLADETNFTDRLIEDGSFMRLSYVTLGYNIPVKEVSFIDSAYISVSGQNLLLFTKYSGFDPEVNSFSFDPGRVGIDWNSFPNQRSYSVSLNITF